MPSALFGPEGTWFPIVAQSLEPDELVGLPVAMTWMRSSPGFRFTEPPVAEVQPVNDPGPGVLGADVGPVQLMIVLDDGSLLPAGTSS